jgi:predicted MFS family arabinose efflux permease
MLVAIASVPPERRGSATGAVLAYMDLGMAAGATAGGLLAAWQGEALAFWVAAAAQLVGVVAIWGAPDNVVEVPAAAAADLQVDPTQTR